MFTLELLHIADQEAGAAAVVDAPNLSAVMNALEAQDLGSDGVADNTLRLSSGDAFIPGVFYDASEAVFGSGGIADIQIQNELGLQAIALGNHEFDFGTSELAGLISGDAAGDFSALIGSSLEGLDFTGTDFPYLSTNLDFSTDANLAPLAAANGLAPQSNVVSGSTVIALDGFDTDGVAVTELIGVVGATTPTLGTISSPDGVGISPTWASGTPTPAELDALAAEIQTEVDALLAANPAMNKVVLLAHMQQLSIELGLAERLTNVDIIVAGGSNTRLFDDNDVPRAGDSDQGQYPAFVTNAGGTSTAVVNTDGSYKYVGRLVIDFDDAGNIIPGSYDETVSGAYATDDAGVAALGAAGLIDPEIQAIADAIEAQIIATEGNVFGVSDVFLNGNRGSASTVSADNPDGVRTQETNLGNLTADANLVAAQDADAEVVVSLKNGGGIRASIGETIVPAGGTEAVRTPNAELIDSEGNVIKPEGGISQTDIQTTLAFNNGLTLLTLTRAEILDVLEHSVGDIGGGRFPQLSGLEFSFDASLPAGERVVNAALVDENGDLVDLLVKDGVLVGDADATVRIVTLNFLANPRFDDDGNFINGGDGYPFPNTNTDPAAGELGDPAVIARVNRVDLAQDGVRTGDATFADDGSEQDALAEYLLDNFAPGSGQTFDQAEVGPAGDERIQNLGFRDDAVLDGALIGTDRSEGIRGDRIEGDIIFAGGGRDNVRGKGGDDVIFGEEGNDNLRGDDGDDVLIGGLGNDRIKGGEGDDVMTGGEAGSTNSGEGNTQDRNVFITGEGNDVITDFDLKSGRERSFDTLKIVGQRKLNAVIRDREDLIEYIEDKIESDGDVRTDAVKDGNDLVLVFKRTKEGGGNSGDNLVDSVRIQNLFDDAQLLADIEDELGRELDVFEGDTIA